MVKPASFAIVLAFLASMFSASMFFASGCGAEGGDLEVTNLEPRTGATTGDVAVRILGNNFRRDISYTVYFGNRRSERSTIMDDHTLLVASPQAETAGPVDVIIAADNGPAFRIAQ